MKNIKFQDFLPKDHPYYETGLQLFKDFDIIKSEKIQCSPTLEMIILLLMTKSDVQEHYIFSTFSYMGIGMGDPEDYKEANDKFEGCSNDMRRYEKGNLNEHQFNH